MMRITWTTKPQLALVFDTAADAYAYAGQHVRGAFHLFETREGWVIYNAKALKMVKDR